MSRATRKRQELIMADLLDRKHVTVKGLADRLSVSEATVRRDLKNLAEKNKLILVHGGATLPRHTDSSFQAKGLRNVEAKKIVAQLAASLVHDGDQIFLDSGTTTFEMAPHLNLKSDLSVLNNSVRLTLELNSPRLSVINLGGQYRPDRMDTIGPIATTTISQLRGFMAFIGADGLSMEFGPAAHDIESAHLYNRAVQNARETVLVADHTKFKAPSLFRIVEWSDIDKVVIDRKPNDEWMQFLDDREIDIIYPDFENEEDDD